MRLSAAKQLSISLGLYRPARAIHRAIHRSEAAAFRAHRKLLSEFIGAGDLTFDVGANIGTRTEIMLSLGAIVVAFEPQPVCVREIRARGNRRLTVVEKAVGSAAGHAQLHLKEESVLASLLPDWEGPDVAVLTVPVTTLDAEISKFGQPRFCKIDVEGFEAEVLRGLSYPIHALSLEYHRGVAGLRKIQACFDIISRFGDYEANLTGRESAELLLPRWTPLARMMDFLPSYAEKSFWGDVFMRIAA